MIIPVAFKLTRKDVEEAFSTDAVNAAIINHPSSAKVSVEIDLINTATGEGHGLSGQLVVDTEEINPYRAMGEMRRFTSVSDAHKAYLRELRDEIDKLLDEG